MPETEKPDILIVDEALAVGDALFQKRCFQRMEQLTAQGTTLLLTTHYMEEAFALCDTILILHQGQKVLQGSPKELLAEHIEEYVLELTENETDIDTLRNLLPGNVRIDPAGHTVRFYSNDIEALKTVADHLPVG